MKKQPEHGNRQRLGCKLGTETRTEADRERNRAGEERVVKDGTVRRSGWRLYQEAGQAALKGTSPQPSQRDPEPRGGQPRGRG